MNLAINGGEKLNECTWKNWPIWNESGDQYLKEVIHSNRWTIRGAYTGTSSMEERTADSFAKFNGSSYCVLTSSGSTGLLAAMEALDIGWNDEVIVPALTWIAPITAVLNTGAIPVLVDVDKNTTCMDEASFEDAITPLTKAVIVVHLHCTISNMDEIMKIARKHKIYVIEDCSQAHGAEWKKQKVGTIGDVGVFSMNQEKVLTSGEGGAVITDQKDIYYKLFRTKTDGCGFKRNNKTYGDDQLDYSPAFMGSNYCLSEFQAAILLSQMESFDSLNNRRNINASYLDNQLREIEGIHTFRHNPNVTGKTYYEYCVFLDTSYYANKPIHNILEAVSHEIGISIHQTDEPVYRNNLFSPLTKRKYKFFTESTQYHQLVNREFTSCESIFNHMAVFHHRYLLGDEKDMDYIAEAFRKVKKYSAEIKDGRNSC